MTVAPSGRRRWMRLPRPRLALVGRELTAIANRPRTYVLRTILALVVLGLYAGIAAPSGRDFQAAVNVTGTQIATLLLVVVLGAMAVVLPAMATVSISSERAQGTLPLLLLTPIGPMRLMLQKWLALIVAVLALLVVALPLGAIAYLCGGVTAAQTWDWSLATLLLLGQAAALCLLVASWSRSVIGGFVLCYIMLGIIEILLPGLMTLVARSQDLPDASWFVLGWNPLAVASEIAENGDGQAGYALTLLSILGSLWLAAAGIRRRSQPAGVSLLVRLLRLIDGTYERLERRWLRRATTRSLPETRPVAWRETHRQPLANLRYLVRLLVVPATVAVCVAFFDVEGAFLWSLAAVLLLSLLAGTRLLAAERADQSLEVLLSTPMDAPAIIRQAGWAAGGIARAGTLLLWVLLAVGAAGQLDTRWIHDGGTADAQWLAEAATAAVILPQVLGWMAGLLALHVRNGAAVLSLAVLVALTWLALPLALIEERFDVIGLSLWDPLVALVATGHWSQALRDLPWPVQIAPWLIALVAGAICRRLCLRTRLLQKLEPAAAA